MSTPASNDLRQLSNADIEVLYTIVLTAQNSSAPQFRALFDAYDAVLARNGIRPEHDQLYFRFLLRMGEHRTENLSLFEQFESLLAKLGFQLDFSDDEESEDEATSSPEAHSQAEKALRTLPGLSNLKNSAVPLRRASFDSSYPIKKDDSPHARYSEHTSPSRPHQAEAQKVERWQSAQAPAAQSDQPLQSYFDQPQARVRLDHPQQRSHGHGRPASMSNALALETGHRDRALSVTNQVSGGSLNAEWDHDFPISTKRSRLSDSQRNLNIDMMIARARIQDRETLLQQSFDQWLTKLENHRQLRHGASVLQALEAKASKARKLFLLTKAFTHWAQTASDEGIRTSAAKRHVLRTRYFGAWRELALVNEIKVRRTILSKFFYTWKIRNESIVKEREQAVCFNDVRLIESSYRAFFWGFCERRAPLWAAENLKNRTLKKWTRSVSSTFESMSAASRAARLATARRALEKLHEKLMQRLRQTNQACHFRRTTLLLSSTRTIQIEANFSPLVVCIERKIESRMALEALRNWRTKAASCVQAALFDHKHTLTRAWSTWNNALRSRAISKMIDERVLSEGLYKWVLAERSSLSRRVDDQRLKQSVMSFWKTRSENLWLSLERVDVQLQHQRVLKCTTTVLTAWSKLKHLAQQQHNKAQLFYREQLLRQAWQQWKARLQTYRQMENWSDHARFYSLATRSVQELQAATVSRKREKRRNAYAIIRRKVKANAAKTVLDKWRVRMKTLKHQELVASRFLDELLRSQAGHILSRWSYLTEAVSAADMLGKKRNHLRLTRNAIGKLSAALDNVRYTIMRADDLLQESLEIRADSLLRKLNWHVFQVKLQQETASSLDDRNKKKHVRSMIKYWNEKTGYLRNVPLSPSPEARSIDSNIPHISRARDAPTPAVDTTSSILHKKVPTPAYLRTPSKRTVKARARFLTPQHHLHTLESPAGSESIVSPALRSTSSRPRAFAARLREIVDTELDAEQ